MIVCVYALVSPAPARLGFTGMAGERLRMVTVDRVTAVVGELRRPPAASIRNLRRYAEVVEAIAARVPAILPARFATTAAHREELTFILKSRHATLSRRLRVVRGRAQMTIRVMGSDPDLTSVTSRTEVGPRNGATQGTQYLRQRMAVAASARAVAGFEPLRAAVQRFVKDERVEKRGGVATVNHLVPRGSADRYRTTLVQAAEDHGVRLIVTGPLAPYAFADNW